MARQLVFTSAPQGLTPGRTGYCTVARHGDLRDRLVPLLEGLSVFPSDWQPAPVICAFRFVDLAGSRVPVLSRIVDAGQDYTHRNHFLAHYLILDPSEIAGAPPPAEIFLRWPGWLNHWAGAPRWLNENDFVNLAALPPAPGPTLPAQTWNRLAGDAGRAALLVEGTEAAGRVLRCTVERENEIIYLFRESSALLSPAECWRTTFTTCLQPAESAAFRWAGLRAGSAVDTTTARSSMVIDLTQPTSLPPAPANAAARTAREGLRTAHTTASPPTTTNIPLIKRSPAIKTAPISPAKPAGAEKSARPFVTPPETSRSNTWIIAALAGLFVVGLGAVILLWPRGETNQNFTPAPAPPAPQAILPPEAISPQAIPPRPDASPNPSSPHDAIADEQALTEINRLASDGKFIDATKNYDALAAKDPDFIKTHADLLKSRLLPGTQKELLDRFAQILFRLNTTPADQPALAAELEILRKFPHADSVPDPAALQSASAAVAAVFHFIDQLPDAPVWVVDNLTPGGASIDYQDVSGTLLIPELAAIMKAAGANFHVSAAPATSILPPSADQWFNFDVQPGDFSSGDYLILHDASRGTAGGRFLQMQMENGLIRLTWRLFQLNSDFFKNYAANAPLRPLSRQFWLHFAGQPPLPSFYLLLRQPDNAGIAAWKPVSLPLAWLDKDGSPATMSLPPWLANNLRLHLLAGRSFYLEPTQLDPAAAPFAMAESKPANTLSSVQYQASWLIKQLQQRALGQQTNLARAQQQSVDLQAAVDGPPERRPSQPALDQAAETVKKLQQDIDDAQAAATATAQADWPGTAAPWVLFYSLPTKDTVILFQFNAHETGPTP